MKLKRPGVLSGLTIAAQLAGVVSALLVVKSLGHILNPVVFTLVALVAGSAVFGTILIFTKKLPSKPILQHEYPRNYHYNAEA